MVYLLTVGMFILFSVKYQKVCVLLDFKGGFIIAFKFACI